MLEPNRTPKLNSIVQQMCRCTLYVVTALSFKQPFEFEFRARDQRRSPWYSDTRKSTVGRSHAYVHIRFHSLPSVSVIPVCPARSPKSHQGHWHPTGIWKGLSTLCGQCPHGLHARTPHVYACQWPPSYSQCPSYYLSAAPLPGPWSARQRPHRFERIVVTLVTDCVHVHTTGDCTRVPCWWSTSNYPWGAWAASTPFHLLHQVQSPTSIDTRYMKDIRPGWQQWSVFLHFFRLVQICGHVPRRENLNKTKPIEINVILIKNATNRRYKLCRNQRFPKRSSWNSGKR